MTKPVACPASFEKLGSKDAYLIDNADYIFLYIGNQVDDSFIQNVTTSVLSLISRSLATKTSVT